MSETAPEPVRALAAQRDAARAGRDFAAADDLRDRIAAAGWLVEDTPQGAVLRAKPPYDVAVDLAALPDRSGEPDTRRVSVALLVEGWPDDLRACVDAVLRHAPPDTVVIGLDVGDVDGAGGVLHELAELHSGHVEEWHVARAAGWGPARNALLRLDNAAVHLVMETSTLLTGDAVSPLLDALAEDGGVRTVGAGWRGANVDLDDAWRSFTDAGLGEVDALLGYLMALRRDAALAAGGFAAKARFYRNADMELSLALRAAGGRLVVPGDLPVRQERHRGYHDSDPELRERESRRTYDRLLARFRGRVEILAPR